jgi:hypothetical protein
VVLGSPAGVMDTLTRTCEGDLASHNQRAVLVTNLSTSVTKEKLLTLIKNMQLEVRRVLMHGVVALVWCISNKKLIHVIKK